MTKRFRLGALSAGFSSVALVACGGAGSSAVFNPFDGGSSSTPPPAGTADGSSSVTPPGNGDGGGAQGGKDSGSTPITDSGSSPGMDATVGDDSSAPPDAQSIVDATPPPEEDTGPAPPPPDNMVPCGKQTCDVTKDVCCARFTGTVNYTCETAAMCSSSSGPGGAGMAIPCASAENCAAAGFAGDVCCSTGNIPNVRVACTSADECNNANGTVLCNPGDPDPCPDPQASCSLSGPPYDPYPTCN